MPAAGHSVVVVTGASSGIGKATAIAFSERGASIVVTARREDALADTARECERRGAQALTVPADVADETAVENVADRAIVRFGRIDIWVNNAGSGVYGRFEEVPAEAWRRAIDTNLFGYVHGARAAVAQFRRQGHGVLINVSSIHGSGGAPFASAYVASKFAVRGLSESLRQELRRERDIHVCSVLPASIDTPFFQHAANYTGRKVKALRPVVAPERVAGAIVRLGERPRREVVVGLAGRQLKATRMLAPWLYERLNATLIEKDQLTDDPAPPSGGNLFEPMPSGTDTRGGWQRQRGGRLVLAPVVALALPAAIAVRRLARERD